MYVPEDYLNYRYIVNYSDNYVVLSPRSSVSASWDDPTTVSCIVNYFYPSGLVLPVDVTFNQNRSFTSVTVSDDFYDRADCPQVMLTSFACLLFICIIFNAVTRLFIKGGIFNAH